MKKNLRTSSNGKKWVVTRLLLAVLLVTMSTGTQAEDRQDTESTTMTDAEIQRNPAAMPFDDAQRSVVNILPEASFTYTANGLSIAFTDLSTDADGQIIAWHWTFGDGNSSEEQNPTHAYSSSDTYLVFLTVFDQEGDSSTTFHAVVAQPWPGGVFGNFTEVTPLDSVFVTPQDEDFWVISTAPADYDSDGDLDIAVLGYYVVYNQSVDFRLLMMRNDGIDTTDRWRFDYQNIAIGELSSGSSDMSWGDADGDGDLDLALGTDGTTVLLRNEAGSLSLSNTLLPGYWEENGDAFFDLRSITWADYDNDGDQDLFLPTVWNDSTFEMQTVLMRNDGLDANGDFAFFETDSSFAPTMHAQSAWADFDADQDLDLLLINIDPFFENGFIKLYTNQGNGQFMGEDILNGLYLDNGEAQWGDYDGDGDLDILLAGYLVEADGSYTGMVLRIYVNNNGVFTESEVLDNLNGEEWIDITAATWADYDSDGDMDILVAGNYNSGDFIEGRAKVYTNNSGVFSDSGNALPAPRASGDRGGTFSWLDMDMDGDLDYFIAGQYFVPGGNGLVEAQMHVYRNDSPLLNSAPTPPTNLEAAETNELAVLLSWDAGSDDHTPGNALTYQLELFRDNLPVVLPAGLPQPGNIGTVNEWMIGALEAGNYTWIIKCHDASYSASDYAEGTFSIAVVGTQEVLTAKTKNIELHQNYPNPVINKTAIHYSLNAPSQINIELVDIMGQVVAEVAQQTQPAGEHLIDFDASNLPNGIYFIKLSDARNTETRKMILSR